MRLGQGDALRLFNGVDGEWLALFDGDGAICSERLRPQVLADGPWLLFSPPKKNRLRFLVEKVTELGATRLQPVTLARTEPPLARRDRMEGWALEAAEQCGRLDLPDCADQQSLDDLLNGWPEVRPLMVCDETGSGRPAADWPDGPAAFLVGPEGGFAPEELERLKARPAVVPVSLGPNILRVETAAVAALAAWQSTRAVAPIATDRDGASAP